jgi:hypothetical protein
MVDGTYGNRQTSCQELLALLGSYSVVVKESLPQNVVDSFDGISLALRNPISMILANNSTETCCNTGTRSLASRNLLHQEPNGRPSVTQSNQGAC